MQTLKAKKPSDSVCTKTEVVCPNDSNPMGILQGGRLVEWMDMAAAVCAQTHAGKICVTASINRVDFRYPARVGDILVIQAKITRAFRTSMEIYVRAWARQVLEPKNQLISESWFRFVALDQEGHPASVPPVKPGSVEERQQYRQAIIRKRNHDE